MPFAQHIAQPLIYHRMRFRDTINRFYPVTTKAERKLELYRLPLASLLAEYQRIKGFPYVHNPPQLTAMLVVDLIQSILDAEFPIKTR